VDPFSYYCEINSNQQNLTELWLLFITLCRIDSRKYISPHLQVRCIILCYKISWPCED